MRQPRSFESGSLVAGNVRITWSPGQVCIYENGELKRYMMGGKLRARARHARMCKGKHNLRRPR
jgi:hypothetical protein